MLHETVVWSGYDLQQGITTSIDTKCCFRSLYTANSCDGKLSDSFWLMELKLNFLISKPETIFLLDDVVG